MMTMEDDGCRHGLIHGTCSLCRPRPARPAGEAKGVTKAQFESRCPECGAPIEQGDLIGRVDDAWHCERCWT